LTGLGVESSLLHRVMICEEITLWSG